MAVARDRVEIDAPERLTRRERARDTITTGVMWGCYFYLWVPLASLFAWALGFELAYDVMIRAGGAQALGSLLLSYAIAIAVILVIVTAWSWSNRIRFRNKDRRGRRGTSSVADNELVWYFGVSPGQLEALRSGRIIELQLDDSGRASAIGIRLGSYGRTRADRVSV